MHEDASLLYIIHTVVHYFVYAPFKPSVPTIAFFSSDMHEEDESVVILEIDIKISVPPLMFHSFPATFGICFVVLFFSKLVKIIMIACFNLQILMTKIV